MTTSTDEKYELHDVEVDTLGLVTRGANREEFFLLKSAIPTGEEPTHEEPLSVENAATLQTSGEPQIQKSWQWLANAIRHIVRQEVKESTKDVVKAELDAEMRNNLSDSDFAYIDSNGVRHLPIHDMAHTRNALARFEQTEFESADAKAMAKKKIAAAARKFGIEMSDDMAKDDESSETLDKTGASTDASTNLDTSASIVLSANTPIELAAEVTEKVSDETVLGLSATTEVTKEVVPDALGLSQEDIKIMDEITKSESEIALEKANSAIAELQLRVEKAEKIAADERDARDRAVYLAKADDLASLPVSAGELADHLFWLSKTDAKRAQWFEATLTATNNLLHDSNLFVEKGTRAPSAELSIVEKATAAVAKGEYKSIREAILAQPKDEQLAYVRQRENAQHKTR